MKYEYFTRVDVIAATYSRWVSSRRQDFFTYPFATCVITFIIYLSFHKFYLPHPLKAKCKSNTSQQVIALERVGNPPSWLKQNQIVTTFHVSFKNLLPIVGPLVQQLQYNRMKQCDGSTDLQTTLYLYAAWSSAVRWHLLVLHINRSPAQST
jgi:hypothetical protein